MLSDEKNQSYTDQSAYQSSTKLAQKGPLKPALAADLVVTHLNSDSIWVRRRCSLYAQTFPTLNGIDYFFVSSYKQIKSYIVEQTNERTAVLEIHFPMRS